MSEELKTINKDTLKGSFFKYSTLSYEEKVKLIKDIYESRRIWNLDLKYSELGISSPDKLNNIEFLIHIILHLNAKVNYLEQFWEPVNAIDVMDDLTDSDAYHISNPDPEDLDRCLEILWIMYGRWEEENPYKEIP